MFRAILFPWRAVARVGVDFVRDRRATMHILLAAGILPLLAAIGLTVDAGLGFMLKNRMGKALDVAGIAAGRVVYSNYYATEARSFFDANFPANFLGAQVTNFTIVPDANKEFITLDATATMPTRFMHIFNINTMTVSAHTVINRQNRGMELALVLDNTGSMRGSAMDTMKAGAAQLVDILYGDEETLPNLWVGVVPFVSTVNIGQSHSSWLVTGALDGKKYEFSQAEVTCDPGQASDGNNNNRPPCPDSHDTPAWSKLRCAGTNVTWDAFRNVCVVGTESVRTGLTEPQCTPIGIWINATAECVVGNGWKGCVEARATPFDSDDTPPGTQPFTPFYYAQNVDNSWLMPDARNNPNTGGSSPYSYPYDWSVDEINDGPNGRGQNNGRGPNLGCGPEILPLVQEKTTVKNKIAEMLPWHRGGTTSNIGLAWGWRVLSPRWRGLWAPTTPADMPLDYNTPLMDKVVVLMTDGNNQFYDWPDHQPNSGAGPNGSDYTAYGRLTDAGFTSINQGNDVLDGRMASECAAMKAQGIIIYTMVYGGAPDNATKTLFQNCASNPAQYFYAPNNTAMADAFRTIGTALSNLRIAQ